MVEVKAYAKINLALDVLHKRSDGYHAVNMIMQSVDLYDDVTLETAPSGITVCTDRSDLPGGPSNLAYRAAALFQETCSLSAGVYITLHKKIPMAAGLAGGSSDAAAVLIGMNELFQTGLSQAELEAIGAKVGSDVPFCLTGGTQLATGRGEQLQRLPDLPPLWVLLVKPSLAVATSWVYQNYSAEKVSCRPDVAAMTQALASGDITSLVQSSANVLESVTLAHYPEVAAIKAQLAQAAPLVALMSGSGPTVFALFTTRDKALAAAKQLQDKENLFITVVKNVVGRNV
ncbi:MAG: 4-(cytidine 5'-diphospho)-2-C-methyl-D-erythritol kinase [Sporomusaceae bacterium]|nr:4-(cytidine 5'-diphospho)-2-C-methyl-D-erythritol kinase [Sporomusaceae bacterium]